MKLIERLLDLVANREDIAVAGSLYLRRWRLLGYNAKLPGLFGRSVMLHRIVRPDQDRDPHDHPWDFWTLVLKGGYVEHIYHQPYKTRPRNPGIDKPEAVVRMPGDRSFRPATHLHRIDSLPFGDAWTLVMTKRREGHQWGFWTTKGWVYWKHFLAEKQAAGEYTTASRSPS